MINFEKFTAPQTCIVPVLNNTFQYNRKKYNTSIEDGWYRASVKGNAVLNISEVSIEIENLPAKNVIKGYTYNDKILFQNFDVAKRKAGTDMMAKLEFNQSPTFSSIEAIIWEDKNIYYYRPNYADTLIYEVKSNFDSADNIQNVKGVSPELKTLYLFHDIERQQLKELQKAIEKKTAADKRDKEIEEYKQTLQGKLITTFNRVGAQVLNYALLRDKIIVDWKLMESELAFNSVIELESLKVVEAGFCLSGSDRDHSAQSMVMLALDYEEKGLIYKTRY